MNLTRILLFAVLLLINACDRFDPQSASEVVKSDTLSNNAPSKPVKLPRACKQPTAVADIWQLEPLLVKTGQIKETMSKAEKESIIHQYIVKKNGQYKACMSSKGKKVK